MYMQQEHSEQTNKSPIKAVVQQNSKYTNKFQEQDIPILTYYYIRGLCQPVRNLLYYLQIQFEDRRLDKSAVETLQLDKLESTFNSGLPNYRDAQVSMTDSVAISIYVCNKYKANYLIGRGQAKAKVNQVLFKYWLEKRKIMPEIAEIIRKTTGIHETQKGVLIRQELYKLTDSTRFLKYCLQSHQKTQSWILEQLTLIDFYFYQSCFYINGFFNSYIEADQRLAYYISFCHKFEQLQFHSRHNFCKTKLFFPFKSQNLKEIIVSAWQGSQEQQII